MIGLTSLNLGHDGLGLALNIAVQIVMVTLIAIALAKVMFHKHAAARHTVWLCALCYVLASPFIPLVARRLGTTIENPLPSLMKRSAINRQPPILSLEGNERPSIRTEPDKPSTGSPLPARLISEIPRTRVSEPISAVLDGPVARVEPSAERLTIAGWFMATWLLGVALLSARLVLGGLAVRGLRRRLQLVDPVGLCAVLAEVRRRLGNVSDLPPIATVLGVRDPFTAGIVRPVVVLPEDLLNESRRDELADVLVHECAHVIRRDHWVGLLQHLAGTLFWPHPLVHLINRRLTRSREEVCDNHVLMGRGAGPYARTLLSLTLERPDRRSTFSFGLLDRRWTLENRVAGLLDERRVVMTRIRFSLYLAVGAVFLTAGGAIAAVRLSEEAQTDRGSGAAKATETVSEPPDPSQARFTGVVVDEQGKPAAGARVNLIGFRPLPKDIITGTNGVFAFNVNAGHARYAAIHATAGGGALQAMERADGEAKTKLDQTFRLTLRAAKTLTARVRDGSGKPVPGAIVEVLDQYSSFATAETDTNGIARFQVPESLKLLWVVGLKSGVGYDYAENYRSWPSPPNPTLPDAVDLTLNGAQTIRVRAVDSSDAPVAGVEFAPWYIIKQGKIDNANLSGSSAARVVTDAKGVATFDWIPREFQRGMTFLVRSEDYQLREQVDYRTTVDNAELSAILLRNATLSGRVTRADGKAMAGVLIQAEGRGNSPDYGRILARTGADGHYSVQVPPLQHFIISVLDAERAAPSLTGIVTREGETRHGFDFRLGRGTLLRGRVTMGNDNQPVKDETITLIQQGEPIPPGKPGQMVDHQGREELVRWARTDAQGWYQLRVGPGTYQLLGPSSEKREREELTVRAEEVLDHDFHISRPPRVKLSGNVVVLGPEEKPLAGAILKGESIESHGHAGFEAIADDQGRFRTERWNDPMLITARSADGTFAGIVKVDPDTPRIKIPVAPAAIVQGRVADDEGQPLASVTVYYGWGLEPREMNRGPLHGQVLTDKEGRYKISGLAVGSHGQVMFIEEDGRSRPHQFTVKAPGIIELPDLVVKGKTRQR